MNVCLFLLSSSALSIACFHECFTSIFVLVPASAKSITAYLLRIFNSDTRSRSKLIVVNIILLQCYLARSRTTRHLVPFENRTHVENDRAKPLESSKLPRSLRGALLIISTTARSLKPLINADC